MIRTIVFDFDNVIVQGSEVCKQASWSKIFDPDSEDYNRCVASQKQVSQEGGDRFDILAATLQLSDLKEGRKHPEVLRLADKYDSAVRQGILNIGIDLNDLQVLEALAARYPLYIISATPEVYLHATISKLSELHKTDLFKLFQMILGTPLSKIENFEKVKQQSGLPYAEMLMIGDGVNDLLSARSVGADFIGVTTEVNAKTWKNETFPKISAVRELPEILQKI